MSVSRRCQIAGLAVVALIMGIALGVITLPRWAPALINHFLPAGATLQINGLRWQPYGLAAARVQYRMGTCVFLDIQQLQLGYRALRWQLRAQQAMLDSRCLSDSTPPGAPLLTLTRLQRWLPSATLDIGRLALRPWSVYQGRLQINWTRGGTHHITYQGERLAFQMTVRQTLLHISQFSWQPFDGQPPITLQGEMQLSDVLSAAPQQGTLNGQLALSGLPEPLTVQLVWHGQQGTLTFLTAQRQPIARLPWQLTARQLTIRQGEWNWPWLSVPLQGRISLTLNDWRQGLAGATIEGRLNAVSQGRGGKGNVVLNIGPGRLNFTEQPLPLRLTGNMNLAQLSLFITLPARLQGALTDPVAHFLPGALLWGRGRIIDGLFRVRQIRWPLSGVELNTHGLQGRLQAVLRLQRDGWGAGAIHVDGPARDFLGNRGDWHFRYWGRGRVPTLRARWHLQGKGRWLEGDLTLNTLRLAVSQVQAKGVDVQQLRVQLRAPLHWQRGAHPQFNAPLRLAARRLAFSDTPALHRLMAQLTLHGVSPVDFLYEGQLSAPPFRPIRLKGRWDGERIRGQAWWPDQPLRRFNALIEPQAKFWLRGGRLRAQVAFSWTDEQGLLIGGHGVIRDGVILIPDNKLSGVAVSLPFRYHAGQWLFGMHQPVTLTIAAVENQFAMRNVHLNVQGYYPWGVDRPFTVLRADTDILEGHLAFTDLQLPQTHPAYLRFDDISLSHLITALHPKQFALSGKIDGAWPFWLDNPAWLIREGWVRNDGSLTLRLDKDLADRIAQRNPRAAAATDWLRYMEIAQAQATLQVDHDGNLTLAAKLHGLGYRGDIHHQVMLNYRHEENLFALWRSLRFGDNLQAWLTAVLDTPSSAMKQESQ